MHYVDVVNLHPYICKFGKLQSVHAKVYVGAGCPVTACTGRVLSNVSS